MKKVLIWNAGIPFRNAGGPGGYLYNIHEYLKDKKNDQIVFLSDRYGYDCTYNSYRKSTISKLSDKYRIVAFLTDIFHLFSWYRKKTLPFQIDVNDYDAIHFHSIFAIISYRDYLTGFKGKVLITTHTPEPPISEISYTFRMIGPWLRRHQEFIVKKELNIIKQINPLWMFPAEDALEPYISLSSSYAEYFSNEKSNLRFIPTATMDCQIQKQNGYFEQFGIPYGSFVISYIGRHTEVKGYDVLKQIATKVLAKYNNIYFIIAGKEEPLKGLADDHWIELGWINNSAEIIANSDLFVLPNNQTYFDLIFLEVLRSGTTILASYTGGNKYFGKELPKSETTGIYYFEKGNILAAVEIIEKLMNTKCEEDGLSNRILWEKYFTIDTYIRKYTALIESL